MLARNGIAVLIYDRRGKGQSTGENVTMDLLAEDAIAAVHYLQSNQWIDKRKIGIMGFSQGGYVAPLAASRSQDIAFIIAGAAPAITPDEQNDFNAVNRLKNIGMSKDSIDYILNLRKEVTDYQFYGKGSKQELELKLTGLKKEKWFQQTLLPLPPISTYDPSVVSFLKFDPLIAWRQVKIPTLLIWGEMDQLVPVEKSKTEITNAIRTAGNKNFQTRIFQNSSHGIAQISKTKGDWPRLAEGYHSLLVAWIKESIR
jgi:dipeptidyl aminopeptidase/acylaminoacyl peptidase